MMATAPAQAETTGDCKDQFDKLRGDITSVSITVTGKKNSDKADKERAGLVNLVDDAETLSLNGKTSDAVKKLSDFTVKVDQLEAASRISAGDDDLLRSDAQETISCLQD
jgi:hypothetical protein